MNNDAIAEYQSHSGSILASRELGIAGPRITISTWQQSQANFRIYDPLNSI